jgi:hypothetical protein
MPPSRISVDEAQGTPKKRFRSPLGDVLSFTALWTTATWVWDPPPPPTRLVQRVCRLWRAYITATDSSFERIGSKILRLKPWVAYLNKFTPRFPSGGLQKLQSSMRVGELNQRGRSFTSPTLAGNKSLRVIEIGHRVCVHRASYHRAAQGLRQHPASAPAPPVATACCAPYGINRDYKAIRNERRKKALWPPNLERLRSRIVGRFVNVKEA